ncbi:hypothetical protein ACFP81_11400 [Deinococcus lacus]|uniref:Uncharacterized protein n=1 Tax=Deinococcus lacus TaxID=392561 RepID=A0ABW1YE24_9DEIO
MLGGGVSKDAAKWLPLLHLERSELAVAKLLNNAGIVGAALYAAQAAAPPATKAAKPATSSAAPAVQQRAKPRRTPAARKTGA